MAKQSSVARRWVERTLPLLALSAACAPPPAPFVAEPAQVVGANVSAAVAGDFDGTGNLDLAVAQAPDASDPYSRGDLSMLLGDGQGDLASPTIERVLSPGDALGSMAAADFDGDGKLDLVAVSSLGRLEMFPGNGDGTFAAPRFTPALGAGGTPAVADFDGDGHDDVAVPLPGLDAIGLFLGRGDGTFATMKVITASTDPGLDRIEAIGEGDLNGDCRPDLAAVVSQANDTANPAIPPEDEVVSLLNRGNGTFRPGPDVSIGDQEVGFACSLVVTDMNGDGKPDLAIGVQLTGPSGTNGGVVYVVPNQGGGTFAGADGLDLYTTTDQLAAGDFDGGGGLAVGGPYPDIVLGGKQMGAVESLPTDAANPWAGGDSLVVPGDFNGDGKGDVATIDPAAGTVQLLLDEAPGAVKRGG
ncbi:MAG: FG-GAP and VCBS repeat-containing protein [Myxococcales bacterium]